jgi:hypothetical protein
VQGAVEVKVTLLDQSSYTAKVVGTDPDKDVAVLQLDMPAAKAAQLQPVSVGMSSGLMVGQKVSIWCSSWPSSTVSGVSRVWVSSCWVGSLCAAGSVLCQDWRAQVTFVWPLAVASAGVCYWQPIWA